MRKSLLPLCVIALIFSACSTPTKEVKKTAPETFIPRDQRHLLADYSDEQLKALSVEQLANLAKPPGYQYTPRDVQTTFRAAEALSSKITSFTDQDLMLLIKKEKPFEASLWDKASVQARTVYIDRMDWPESIKSTIREKSVQMGMTPDQVIVAWGMPHRVNSTTNRYGTSEQWVYDWASGPSYLYFKNALLDSVSQSTRK